MEISERGSDTMSRNRLLIWSLAIALLSFATRWIIPAVTGYYTLAFVVLSGALAIAWLAVSFAAISYYRRRGLLVLIGAPLVLFWPVWLIVVLNACAHGADCI